MRRTFAAAAALAALIVGTREAGAAQPYVMFEAGIISRDIVEEDVAIEGFSFGGEATSTRMLATVGLDLSGFLSIYAQGGAANLAIDEFNGFDSSFNGAYGGGVRLTFPLAPQPLGLRLFVEGSFLHTTAEDTVQIVSGNLPRIADEEIEWNEFTVLMGAGSRYGPWGPYGGVRLSWVDGEDRLHAPADATFPEAFRVEADLREQDNFGAFFGTDLFLDRAAKTALNFEVSLFDQYSFRAAIRRAF